MSLTRPNKTENLQHEKTFPFTEPALHGRRHPARGGSGFASALLRPGSGTLRLFRRSRPFRLHADAGPLRRRRWRIRRLRRQQLFGAILLLVTGALMLMKELRIGPSLADEWKITLTIAVVFEAYTAFRLPAAKE